MYEQNGFVMLLKSTVKCDLNWTKSEHRQQKMAFWSRRPREMEMASKKVPKETAAKSSKFLHDKLSKDLNIVFSISIVVWRSIIKEETLQNRSEVHTQETTTEKCIMFKQAHRKQIVLQLNSSVKLGQFRSNKTIHKGK